jgi:uncharacterized Tic20 family protein
MNELGSKIKEARKRKGYSQEELAELAKVNLRTIQRIEKNENEPRGKTLNLICDALDLNTEDLLDYGKETDKTYLICFHLSVLCFLAIPIGNIILPLILWITKKDKIIGLKEAGANLLNFQIIWTFITFSITLIGALLKIIHFQIGHFNGNTTLLLLIPFYTINIVLVFISAIKARNGKTLGFYPNIIRLIK